MNMIHGNQTLDMKEDLKGLLDRLLALGKDLPYYLVSLTQVVQPNIPDNMRFPLLGKMFAEVPQMIADLDIMDVVRIVENPPLNAVTLRLLLDLRQIQVILRGISITMLLQLTYHLAPVDNFSPNQQLESLNLLQKVFKEWSKENIEVYSREILKTPFHLQKAKLLELDQRVHTSVTHFVIEFLKMNLEEIIGFKMWIQSLNENMLIILVNLLQMDANVLVEIKNKLTSYEENTLVDYPGVGNKRKRYGDKNSQKSVISETLENIEISKIAPQSKRINNSNTVTSDDLMLPFVDLSSGNILSVEDPFVEEYEPTIESMFTPLEDNKTIQMPSNTFEPFGHSNSTMDIYYQQQQPEPLKEPKPKTKRKVPTKRKTTKTPQSQPTTVNPVLPISSQTNNGNLTLRIQKQPPSQTVYQRIIKPNPVVMLIAPPNFSEQSHNLFVECQLLNDKNVEIQNCLDGNKIVRISPGVFATFRKLKILSTSQQQGTLFRLKFQLKRYVGNVFEPIDGTEVVSNSIEVFSHTYYLSNKKNKTTPPKISEILPYCGPSIGGTRLAIIGSNFIKTNNLYVKIGEVVITPEYHETGTLIVTTPPGHPGHSVPISISNDGKEYSNSGIMFNYT